MAQGASEFLVVLLYSLLPALGNFGGGLLAERVEVSERRLSLALHGAAGVVVAIVALELMPEAIAVGPTWIMAVAFILGGLFFVAVDRVTNLVSERFGGGVAAGPWVLFFGVSMDLFSDGVMIGAGSSVAIGLGLLLALGQVPADVPEGFATMATFKRAGVPRRRRLLIAAAFALPILLGATVGYWAVRGQPEWMKMALLTFTAGVLTTLVMEEISPEAHQGGEARTAALWFVGGFALFSALTVLLE